MLFRSPQLQWLLDARNWDTSKAKLQCVCVGVEEIWVKTLDLVDDSEFASLIGFSYELVSSDSVIIEQLR